MKKLAALCVLLGLAVLLAAGCATTAKAPSDEELITKRIGEGVAAIKAKDFAAFNGMVAQSFSSDAVGEKEDLLAYLENANDAGFLDDIEIDLSEAKTVVTGDKATVALVTASGNFGSITLNFEGVKEKGVWLVSGVEPGF